MAKGGSKAKTQATSRIGRDPLSQALTGGFLDELAQERFRGVRENSASQRGAETIANAGDVGGVRGVSLDAIRDTAAGNFLDPSFLGAQIEAVSAPAIRNFRRAVAPSIASEFAAAGRTGSGAERAAFEDAEDVLARNIAEVAAGSVDRERGRQVQAAGFLPSLVDSELRQGQAQIGVGQRRENLERERTQSGLSRLISIAGALPGLREGVQTTQGTKSGKGGALGSLAGGVAGSFLGPLGTAAGSQAGNALFGGATG